MLPSLVYLFFELDIEQGEIRKTLLIHKQKTEWIEWFCFFWLIILSILDKGASNTTGF